MEGMIINMVNNIFILPEKVNISAIESLKEEFINFIKNNNEIAIDASIVEEIDAAGFQLILSFHKLCILQSKEFYIFEASNVLRNALELCGLVELIKAEY